MHKSVLVSCIMPTYNRREFVPLAIFYFKRQSFLNKELIILDDGTDSIADLVPNDSNIRYYRFEEKITLGEKLNLACEYANGSIIVNWDDDDWYNKRRIDYQVEELHKYKTSICGINHLLYLDIRNLTGYKYIYPADQKTWLLGSSLCYTKEFWENHRFAHINVGMDGLFVWSTTPDRITVLPDPTFSVHMIHKNNISPKQTNQRCWNTYPISSIQSIMGEDWKFYEKNVRPALDKMRFVKSDLKISRSKPDRELRNVFACLVHEKEDCVHDLVRNLNYHNPNSTIILYNGGRDQGLLKNTFDYGRYNAVLHPVPKPQQHGYLHGFALDCFKYVIQNLHFDTLTVIDSDQLCIKSGYSGLLAKTFSASGKTGLLSNFPQRIEENDRTNYVACRAYKELELWKPFLESFPYGKDSFVYWSFWPGTVFTYDSIKAILELFNTNKKLQDIMNQTKIWATEEVVFPTLVKLLGFEIEANPTGYDYMKYKTKLDVHDFNQALSENNIYWMHPVERSFNNPLRTFIRKYFSAYKKDNKLRDSKRLNNTLMSEYQLINDIRKIEGWLSDEEALLLVDYVIKTCKNQNGKINIVEVGSYHGKSTVLFGSIIKEFNSQGKVYAIDIHDGKLGAVDQGLISYPPSFERFTKNISNANVAGEVEIIRDKATNINWDAPISFLFIDGLHDYQNVSADFFHFSDYLLSGGYVAFHDCADYYPGVKKLVHEILERESFTVSKQVDSLIVLKKVK